MDKKYVQASSKSECRRFIEELIEENIELTSEVIRLRYENRRLSERNRLIEAFYKLFGIKLIIRDGTGGFRN
jgi:hypothetical protein